MVWYSADTVILYVTATVSFLGHNTSSRSTMADLHTEYESPLKGLNLKGNFVLKVEEKAHNLTKAILPPRKSRMHPKWEYGNVLILKKSLWNLVLSCICQGLVQVVQLQAIWTIYLYGTLFWNFWSDHLLTETADEIILEWAAEDIEKEQNLHRRICGQITIQSGLLKQPFWMLASFPQQC